MSGGVKIKIWQKYMRKEGLHLLQIIIMGIVIQESDKNKEMESSQGSRLCLFSPVSSVPTIGLDIQMADRYLLND